MKFSLKKYIGSTFSLSIDVKEDSISLFKEVYECRFEEIHKKYIQHEEVLKVYTQIQSSSTHATSR